MDKYIDIPLITDASQLVQDAFSTIQARYPDWEPNDGDLDVILLEIVAAMAAELRDTMSDVARSIFRYFGANLAGVPPIDATPASGASTWTARDNAGYLIPAGTVIGVPGSAGTNDLWPFKTTADVLIPAGSTSTAVGAVSIVAVEPGSGGNSRFGTAELQVALDFVTAVNVAPTSGGQDAESDDDYLDKLAGRMKLMTARPILARDAAELVRVSFSDVFRATAVDNFIPAGAPNGGTLVNQYNVPRAVYVVPQKADGTPVVSATLVSALSLLLDERETNFLYNVGNAYYVSIDVSLHGYTWQGFDPSAVASGVQAAITNLLNPATWGSGLPTGEYPVWFNDTTLRLYDVVARAYQIPGVSNIDSAEIAITGNALGTADIDMSAGGAHAVTLPQAGTVTVTMD